MKPLKKCANGDGNPVCPPSKVLCKQCLDGITTKLEKLIENLEDKRRENEAN